MPMWHCPHCGTPQAEAARCWVCRKSSTSCATCRHFRHSVAAQLGYCGLDRARQPLRGDEIRPCWEGAVAITDVGGEPATTRPAWRPAQLDPGVSMLPLISFGSAGAEPVADSTSSTRAGTFWVDTEP